MTILDRYNGKSIDKTCLPDEIQLGRYVIVNGQICNELTETTYKPREGQHINQELLDPVNTDKHDIFKKISLLVEEGNFVAVPMIQEIRAALDAGEFIEKLELNMFHIEAIFHDPYSKLNRSIEKVPVSRAKRISNRSNQYLAAHTEDWLHKSLVSFHPSRILAEEVIIDEDVYENQLLIAFVTRTAQYLERRINFSGVIKKFLEDYSELMNNYNNGSGWYRKIRREQTLAGEVYDEEGDNYHGRKTDTDTLSSVDRRLRKLRDSLLNLRQFDLFSNVDQRKVSSIQYHDTNVLVNHKHYRYLKELWFSLLEEDKDKSEENKVEADDIIIKNVRNYGLALINYGVRNVEYLGYSVKGCDTNWVGTKEGFPELKLSIDKTGVIIFNVGQETLRFVVLLGIPSPTDVIPDNTYILAYDNSTECTVVENRKIIPVSLNNVTCVEKVITVIRETMFKQYLMNTVFKKHSFPYQLTPYVEDITNNIRCISFDTKEHVYRFEYYPDLNINTKALEASIFSNQTFKSKNRFDQQSLSAELDKFIKDYETNALTMADNLCCFDFDCRMPISNWMEGKLTYMECSCGFVIDSTDPNNAKFYKKQADFSSEEMGMDYLNVSLDL